MRTFFFTVVCAALCTIDAHAGPEVIVKQRAKNVRDQNNAQQGVAPAPANNPPVPAQKAPPPPPAPLTPQQQSMLKLKSDFAMFKPGVELSPEQKQQFAKDLGALAQGQAKPSQASFLKLANSLSSALSGKTVAPAEQTKLANSLAAILNGANLSAAQLQPLTKEVQMALQMSGVKREVALGVVSDLNAVAAEVQKSAKK